MALIFQQIREFPRADFTGLFLSLMDFLHVNSSSTCTEEMLVTFRTFVGFYPGVGGHVRFHEFHVLTADLADLAIHAFVFVDDSSVGLQGFFSSEDFLRAQGTMESFTALIFPVLP
jgi:hypothetical protein